MHLNFLASVWFEVLVLVLLVGRDQIDRRRSLPRRSPSEIAVLIAAGIGLVALVKAEQMVVAAVVLVLFLLADTVWTHRRPAAEATP